MTQEHSPLRRSIGFGGFVWWLLAAAAVIAVGAALQAGRFGMGAAAAAFCIGAAALRLRARRAD